MSLVASATRAVERTPLPDPLLRAGISLLVGRAARRLRRSGTDERAFAAAMTDAPIAEHTGRANAQHYELPAAFFGLVLGPRRKYSCCLYDGTSGLAEAEERALAETVAHADLADGQRILELGCGWGSLTLWMAGRLPRAQIVAVSNSVSQRQFIEAEAERQGLHNVQVLTADMNSFTPGLTFDRIVSVEMFEHMANWRQLLRRLHGWLEPNGRLFVHVFSHRSTPYRFDHADPEDWIAQHFFTGGVMPSHGLIRYAGSAFVVEAEWRWNGRHYRRTARDWLANYDARADAINVLLRSTYGHDAALWRRRWRLFFLATEGLFGSAHGDEWGVSHYRLRRA